MSTVYYNGPYDPSRGYGPGALVQFGGHTYICTAPVPACHKYSEDDFTGRTVKNGWGTASDGHSKWTVPEINNQSRLQNFSVKNGLGLLTYPSSGILLNDGAGGGFYVMFGSVQSAMERDLLVRFRITQAQSGWITEFALHATPDWSDAGPDTGINQSTTDTYVYFSGSGNDTGEASQAIDPGVDYSVRLRAVPPTYTSRIWVAGTAEPETWDTTVTGSFSPSPGQVLFDPRWDSGAPNQVFQLRYIAQLGINPTPDNDARFDQIA